MPISSRLARRKISSDVNFPMPKRFLGKGTMWVEGQQPYCLNLVINDNVSNRLTEGAHWIRRPYVHQLRVPMVHNSRNPVSTALRNIWKGTILETT